MRKTAIFLLLVKFLTENLKFLSSDFYSSSKFCGTCGEIHMCFEPCNGRLRPLLAIYLLRMRRKQPLYYFRFIIWPRNWVPRVRFLIGPNILAIEPRFQSILVNFLLWMRRNGHISTSVENLMPDLSTQCPISYRTWNFRNYTMFRAIFAQSFTAHAQKRPFFYLRSNF